MPEQSSNKFLGWILNLPKVEYNRVLEWQRKMVKMRKEGMIRDTLIMVEHPPVITVGKDGHKENFDDCNIKPIFIERGGDVTFHGPGQLVVYFIFNLTRRGRDLHLFMRQIQTGIIEAIKDFGIDGRMDDDYTGVWVGDNKLASIGVAVKSWVTFHGAAINIDTDLDEFKKINPCGLKAEVMTSLSKLTKKKVTIDEFRKVLLDKYREIFDTDFYSIQLDEIAEDIESQAGGSVI